MPIMDGEQALSFIQSIGCVTPVIALTANTMSHEVERYKKLGFCDHLSKPIDRQQFCAKIAHYLSLPPQFDIDLPAADMNALKEQYIKGLEPQRIKMQNQLQYGDAEGIRKSIHAIKGSASMFGCDTLQQLANKADQAVKVGDDEQTKRLGEEMIEHMLSLSQQCDVP
ncbi:response regulator [Pseudoalteromonas sp. GB56]